MSDEKCPTCGSAVRVVGKTTMHYEPRVTWEMIEKLFPKKENVTEYVNKTENTFAEKTAFGRGLRWLRDYIKKQCENGYEPRHQPYVDPMDLDAIKKGE